MSESAEKKFTVLVIEDELQMRRMLRLCLERDGYQVVEAATGDDGIAEALRCQPDAIFLDLGLPDMDGLQVLKRIREWSSVPIFVVSVRGEEEEKVSALDNGANDYITKPFGTSELLARLRVVQRYGPTTHQPTVFKTGDLEVDLGSRTVTLKGRPVKLTATEYSLLVLFVQNAGKLLTHGYILREVWGTQNAENTAPLRVYVGYLREKLEARPEKPTMLVTEAGVGYRLVVKN